MLYVPRHLPMNLNVSERLIGPWGLSRSTDRVTGEKNKGLFQMGRGFIHFCGF